MKKELKVNFLKKEDSPSSADTIRMDLEQAGAAQRQGHSVGVPKLLVDLGQEEGSQIWQEGLPLLFSFLLGVPMVNYQEVAANLGLV